MSVDVSAVAIGSGCAGIDLISQTTAAADVVATAQPVATPAIGRAPRKDVT